MQKKMVIVCNCEIYQYLYSLISIQCNYDCHSIEDKYIKKFGSMNPVRGKNFIYIV